jgi:flagellar biosynthesis anti-sigma factor FlgM
VPVEPTPSGTPISIESARIASAQRAAQRAAKTSGVDASPDGGGRRDAVQLSREGRRMASFDAAAADAPEQRSEIIARLKAEVDAGDYRVNQEALAAAMLDRDES